MRKAGTQDDPNLGMLTLVATALGDLRSSLVFVGGCATGLLITTSRSESIRATQDVDVVAQVATTIEYHQLEAKIADRGFAHDQSIGAPICRWVCGDIKLDLMPTAPGILGFHNRWYPLAVETATWVEIPGGITIRLIAPAVFIATKLEAFHGRGAKDYLASHDLEDILSVIDGRAEVVEDAQSENVELRRYLSEQFSNLLADPDFVQAIPGHLPADRASQARFPELMKRVKQLAALNSV